MTNDNQPTDAHGMRATCPACGDNKGVYMWMHAVIRFPMGADGYMQTGEGPDDWVIDQSEPARVVCTMCDKAWDTLTEYHDDVRQTSAAILEDMRYEALQNLREADER